jgi:membrane associated rhomboid family serine protease
MQATSTDPLESVLRFCAEAAPVPWYPRLYAQRTGVEYEVLGDILEFLFLEGLVHLVDRQEQSGPGFRLTPLGERVLGEEALLERLRQGEPVVENDTGSRIRQTLRRPARPVVAVVMLVLNLLFFGYGLVLAMQLPGPAVQSFLAGGMLRGTEPGTVRELLHRSGSVSSTDILRGEWWRLLTATFCHGGLLHLAVNMYGLWVLGRVIEGRWGSWRYLIIYLLGAWTGSCVGVAFTPGIPLVGASGALCGVLGAELFWVVVTGRYLPRSMVRRERRVMVINAVLVVFVSLIPGVSGWGHLGGGIGGFLAAALLYVQRFGSVPMRWLAVPALLPLPWLGWLVLDRARVHSEGWQRAVRQADQEAAESTRRESAREVDAFNKELEGIQSTLKPAWTSFEEKIDPVVDRHPTRREAEDVDSALAAIPRHLPHLRKLREHLAGLGPYRDAEVEGWRRTALAYTEALIEVYERSERCLKEKTRWKADPSEKAREARKAWQSLLG